MIADQRPLAERRRNVNPSEKTVTFRPRSLAGILLSA